MNEGWAYIREGVQRRDGFTCRMVGVTFSAELGENEATVHAFYPDGKRFVYNGRQQWRDYNTPMDQIDEEHPLPPEVKPPTDDEIMIQKANETTGFILEQAPWQWSATILRAMREAYILGQESMDG